MNEPLTSAFGQLHADLVSYYARWYHARPMVIPSARRDELRTLHRVLYKCIAHMVEHYREYVPKYMPLDDREMAALEMQEAYPFRAGTYRPDYIVSEDGGLMLCEITSRFFAHGIFMFYFSEWVADRFMEGFPDARRERRFEEMLAYMLALPGKKRDIVVLKSADKTSEIKLYAPFYRHFGRNVTVLEAGEVEANVKSLGNAFVLSALNQRDLMSYRPETLRAMVDAGMVNDLRTIFLIHDKRFMRLWFLDEFTDRCLSPGETAFLRAHAIPTWLWGTEPGEWEKARLDKNGYILKHHRLGKSEQVYAGPMTDDALWQAQWTSGAVRDMILQPFIRQRRYPTVWEGTAFEDYICGMMLCVDDQYFDSGLFRASSLPVTNKGDDRKICPIHTDDPRVLRKADVL